MMKSGPKVVGYIGNGGGQLFRQGLRVEMEMNGTAHYPNPNQHQGEEKIGYGERCLSSMSSDDFG